MGISRRRFLEDSVIAGAVLASARFPELVRAEEAAAAAVGANDKVRVAMIGCGGRGGGHLGEFLGMRDAIVTAVVDPDLARANSFADRVEKKGQPKPKVYQDIRKMCDEKAADAVSIATTNHWHSLAAIWAMQAGMDVYVEKPVSHNVWEGRKMVEAAAKYGRICQAGTQCRASVGIQEAIAYMHAGKLGKISVGRGLCYKPRGTIGPKGEYPVPAGVDYDAWLGPAPMKPVTRQRFHYDWHWFWDYGNGDLGNQGIHQMDLTRWGLNKKSLPTRAIGFGGRFGYEDSGETPNTHIAVLEYDDCQLIFETRGLKTDALQGAKIGCIFYGTEGTLVITSYSAAIVLDKDGKEVTKFNKGGDHFANFMQCVRSRKTADQFGPIEDGHLSSALCHVGNVSYQLGTPQPFNEKTKAFGDNKEAYETLERTQEHLKANAVPMDGKTYIIGRSIKIDPKTEKPIGDRDAAKLFTREYRKPWVVPDKV